MGLAKVSVVPSGISSLKRMGPVTRAASVGSMVARAKSFAVGTPQTAALDLLTDAVEVASEGADAEFLPNGMEGGTTCAEVDEGFDDFSGFTVHLVFGAAGFRLGW
jgi:hypothetical protein